MFWSKAWLNWKEAIVPIISSYTESLMPLHQFLISDQGDEEELGDQLCVVLISQKTACSDSVRFITVIPNDNSSVDIAISALWFLGHMLSLSQCCLKVKTELVWDVQPGNTQRTEEATRVEKPCCISGKNARDKKKPHIHTQNTHKSREARKNRVRRK